MLLVCEVYIYPRTSPPPTHTHTRTFGRNILYFKGFLENRGDLKTLVFWFLFIVPS